MRRTVVLVVGVIILAAIVPVLAQDAAKIGRGKQVYAEQKCAPCHSIAGVGNKKGPLDGVGSRLSAEEVRLWMVDPATMTKKTEAERKPPMKAYKLSPEDLDALVAYMLSLKGK